MKAKIDTYQDLEAWKKSMDLAEKIYELTKRFPKEEQFGLTSQIRRAAVSIPSNIAEGFRRKSKADFAKFVTYAYGSGAELETQLQLSIRIKILSIMRSRETLTLLDEVMKILNGLHRSLR